MAEATSPKPRRGRGGRIVLIVLGALIFLFAFFLGSLKLVHLSESTPFCSLCHVMKPEYTALANSPHPRTDCGTCHVGPGAWPVVQAKLQNVRYLWVYPLGLYKKPIESPIKSLRPVEYVCEQCHWPQKFYNDRVVTVSHYGQDEANTLTQTELVLKTGGGQPAAGLGRGIHWHIANPVWYIATDEKRQVIPYVKAEFNGKVTEYVSTDSALTPEQIAKAEMRKVDCVDCHNRATHIFTRPAEALDAAMRNGVIPADLPALKQQGQLVLEQTYKTEDEAAKAIAAVEDFYKTKYPDVYAKRGADVEKAVAGLQDIFDRTQFPFIGVTWETHADNIGHKDFPGCFRCHDGKHLSSDKQAIRLECNICHTIPQVATGGKPLPAVQIAPAAKEPDSHLSTSWLSEHRAKFDVTCAGCHTLDNPGGSDNSSFCSNSACHGSQWKYVGLNAPQVRQQIAAPRVPSSGVPPAIPHPISARTDCRLCHAAGKVRPFPDNHAGYAIDMCVGCHQATLKETPPPVATSPVSTPAPTAAAAPAAGGPPAIPHDLAGRDNCLLCHDPNGAVKPAPKDHVGRTVENCQGCHKPAATAGAATPAGPGAGDLPAILHDIAGRDNCLLCHDPNGNVEPAPKDHVGRTVEFCQGCHKPKS